MKNKWATDQHRLTQIKNKVHSSCFDSVQRQLRLSALVPAHDLLLGGRTTAHYYDFHDGKFVHVKSIMKK